MPRTMQVPPVTLSLLTVVAIVFAWPELGALFVQDPDAIRTGELWRLFTGSLVHSSGRHLLLDVVTLGIAGVLIERRGDPHLLILYVASSAAIGVAMHVLMPDSVRFGGLSSVAFATVVYLSLQALGDPGPCRWAGAAVLGCASLVLALDLGAPGPMLVGVHGATVPAGLSHLIGFAIATIVRMAAIARPVTRGRDAQRTVVGRERQTLGRMAGRRRGLMEHVTLPR